MPSTAEHTEEIKTYTIQEAIEKMDAIVSSHQIMDNVAFVTQLSDQIHHMYQEKNQEKLEAFLEENPEATATDFAWRCENKERFDYLLSQFKKEKKRLIAERKKQEEQNYEKKKQLIEELKALVDETIDFPSALKQVFSIKDQWKSIGLAPIKQRNLLWNDYQFHLERFFDQLHLDKEIRDKEFEQNLALKKDLIKQAEKLLDKDNIQEAFIELQALHRIWKEEIGPIAKEHRKELWDAFSAITSKIHERKDAHREALKKQEEENYQLKSKVIDQLKEVNQLAFDTHKQWQLAIETVEKLRKAFEAIGRVPVSKKNEQWQEFKKQMRTFSHSKNEFYRLQKKKQQEVLEVCYQMIAQAEALKDSEDFETTTPILKKLQNDWKNAGPIPRKRADELWGKFKEACNHYFDRLRADRQEKDAKFIGNYEQKVALFGEVEKLKNNKDHALEINQIKNYIDQWKAIGRVPQDKRAIENQFYGLLDELFEQLDLSRRESKLMIFKEKIEKMFEEDDQDRIANEVQFIKKKLNDLNADLIQFKNNLSFFSSNTENNPLLKEAKKNIKKLEEEKEIWREKLNIMKSKINA